MTKEKKMNSNIYIDEVLELMGVPFYEKCNEIRKDVLWMNDGTAYYTFKLVEKFRTKVGLKRIFWLPQSLDLNPIENL